MPSSPHPRPSPHAFSDGLKPKSLSWHQAGPYIRQPLPAPGSPHASPSLPLCPMWSRHSPASGHVRWLCPLPWGPFPRSPSVTSLRPLPELGLSARPSLASTLRTATPQCLLQLPGLISHLSISHHLHTLSLLLVPFFLKFVGTVMHVSPQGQCSNWSGPSETMCKTVWVFFSRDSPQLSSDSQRGP